MNEWFEKRRSGVVSDLSCTFNLLTRVEHLIAVLQYSSLQKNTQAAREQRNGTKFKKIFSKNIFHFLFPLNINEYSLQIARIFLVVRSRAPLYSLNVTSMHAGKSLETR